MQVTRRKGLFHYVTPGSNVERHVVKGSLVQSRVESCVQQLSVSR